MSYKIPLFDLNVGAEEEQAVVKTIRSKWISMGANVREVEEMFCSRLDAAHSIAVTNCTAALHLAMKILGVSAGDEVIVPSLTFVATANAVLYMGATPVFADIQGVEDFSIDPADIEKKITPRTKAIVVMHYGGFSCDMDRIMSMAKKHGVYVVEDAAHAPNSGYKGKKLGAIGDMGCFSFYSNKNISCGEGGLLITNNKAFGERARLLRSHGMTTVAYDRAKGHATTYDVVDLGYNFRMDDIRAAMLVEQIKKLDDDTRARKVLRERYVEALDGVPGLRIPYLEHVQPSSNYIFPVVIEEGGASRRDAIRERLKEKGIETSIHYPPVHKFSVYEPYRVELPNTEFVAEHEFTLPLYKALGIDEIKYISDQLRSSL